MGWLPVEPEQEAQDSHLAALMRRLSVLALVPASLFLVAGCQTADATDPAAATSAAAERLVAVEVDIMSGVPNPTWTTDAASASRLADLVADLDQSSDADGAAQTGLGFRGFVVRGLDLSRLGRYDELTVCGETVIASGEAAEDLTLRDPERAMFTELRTASEEHLAPELFHAIPVDGI